MNYVISEELANQVLVYLSARPYQEVINLITPLQILQKVDIINPQTKGVDESVQSSQTESKTETPAQQASGQESNGEETKPSE